METTQNLSENFELDERTKAELRIKIIETNKDEIKGKINNTAYWFYAIAGLSLVNSLFTFSGANFNFIFGLSITQIVDGVVMGLAGGYHFSATLLNLLISGLFVFLGHRIYKLHKSAFITGSVLYFLDALINLCLFQWLALGFHLFLLFGFYKRYKDILKYEELIEEQNCLVSFLSKAESDISIASGTVESTDL